eukprot:CAMPEP_0170496776 /NCGR_PEP_ID=MMETSP0208-20121228/22642_1 /TAXON_ID=197538 /ORGANISM="Strombidium inclinatum, Strain S3" /LENGTH=46 /DNA_ID= /DNA_START= /DNA_END= /DNA_ORIENTATION=
MLRRMEEEQKLREQKEGLDRYLQRQQEQKELEQKLQQVKDQQVQQD